MVRLHDIKTGSCYKARDDAQQHASSVNGVAWAPDGSQFATVGDDGCIKLWDGVAQCVSSTMESAHGGAPLLSAVFSKSGRYLLSSATDGSAHVWDLAAGRVLLRLSAAPSDANEARQAALAAAAAGGSALHAPRGAVWSHDESAILMPAMGAPTVRVFASRGGRELAPLVGHSAPLLAVATSPVEPALLTAGLDGRARFWIAT